MATNESNRQDASVPASGTLLKIEAEVAPDAPLARPFMVSVTVENTSGRPLVVNKRLAVGYRDSLARELFVTWENATGSAGPPRLVTRDYERPYATDEYAILPAGSEITTSFDLWKWYRPTEPGTYQVVFHYQADEAHPDRPDDVVRGVHSSATYTVRATNSRF
jgi:hypothetical protein